MNRDQRPLWIAVTLIASVGIGAVSAWLAFTSGHDPAKSALSGGGAFGGAVIVILALLDFAAS